MPGVLTGSMLADRTGVPASAAPEPGWGAQFGASLRLAEDEVSSVQEGRTYRGYLELEKILVDMGEDRASLRHKPIPSLFGTPGVESRVPDMDAIWAGVERARQRDPRLFSTVPKTREAYEQQLLTREGARASDQRTVAAPGWTGQVAGGIVGGFTDPVNVLTLPIGGGGKTVLQAAAREAGINALIEGLQQPDLATNKARMGERLSPLEAVENVVGAGVGGFVLGGTMKGIGTYAPAAREAALAKLYPMLPESVRSRFGRIEDVPDSVIADLAETALGRDNLTPDEISAFHVLRREDEIAATNPFKLNGAGIDAHAEGLRSAMERILSDVPVRAPPPGLPGLRASTAISSGTVDGSPRSVVKNRIGVVENASGSNTARPIGKGGQVMSSALGKYQFTTGTWNALYERRFGKGLSAEAMAAKRTDPRLQDILMDDLMAANGAALRRGGQAETPGNLYLAHFAGSDGALRLLQADPAARAADVLGDKAARANPWMRDMSAADLIGWAERKMGQSYPSPRAGDRVEIAGGDPEDALQRQLQERLDRLEGERLALEAERPDVPLIDPDDVDVVPVDLGELDPIITPRAKPVRRAPMDLFQFLASKGGLIPEGVERAPDMPPNARYGHDLKGMFGRNPFVPGIGTLLREKGMPLDRALEQAVEAGYFGDPRRTDLTVADFLEALDRQARGQERLFVPKDEMETKARRERIQAEEDYAEFDQRLRDAAGDRGIDDLDDDDALRAYELWDGESFETTLDRVIAERLAEARMEVLAETDPDVYAQMRQIEELGYGARRPDDGSDPGWADEPGADPGNTRESGEGAADGGSPAAVSRSPDDAAPTDPGDLIPEVERARWDAPDGDAATGQAQSIEHDWRATLGMADPDDPNLAARQAQEAALRAAAPLQGSAKTGQAQDGTMGLGLFDAVDQPGFRLEEEGGTVDPADLLARLDEEEAAIKGIEDCL